MTPSIKIGRFRPASKADIGRYARNLQWLLESPLQSTQELLARIYGFSSLHELQKSMEVPGKPGPFDDVWEDFEVAKAVLSSGRENRLLELVEDFKGRTWTKEVPSRFWASRDMGLFCSPPEHRNRVSRLRNMIDVLSGSTSPAGSVLDYATLKCGDGQESRSVFTSLGQAVFAAAKELIPDRFASDERWDHGEPKLRALIAAHPENPWPFAMFLDAYGLRYWQASWDQFAGQDRLDAQEGFLTYATSYALDLLPDVKRSLALFEELYDTAGPKLAGPMNTYVGDEYGADSFFYPSLLYWGGRVAENAGELNLAGRCYAKLLKIDSRDGFGARFPLATLRLSLGKGSIQRLFTLKGQNRTNGIWPYMSASLEAYGKEDLTLARQHFATALLQGWAVLEPFTGQLPVRNWFWMNTNICTPAAMQEFMHRTEAWWDRFPRARSFFVAIASNEQVREAVMGYHKIVHRPVDRTKPFDNSARQRERLEAERWEGRLMQVVSDLG